MARYLVTGGGGFIGSHIVETLLGDGEAVRVLDDFSTGFRHNLEFGSASGEAAPGELEILEGDIRSPEDVGKACEGIEFVLHQAALSSVPRSLKDPLSTHQVNASGTLNLLIAARDAGVRRFVYASSSSVYGENPELPKREAMTPQPLSPYAASKLAAEHYCRIFHRIFGLETIALRYFNIFGPRQDPDSPYAAVIPRFLDALLAGRPPVIYGDGRQSRDFTFVENAVHANLQACRAPAAAAGEAYNIAGGNQKDLLWLAQVLSRQLDRNISPVHEDPRAGDVRHSRADITRAEQALDFHTVVSVEEGLQRTVEWYRGQAAGNPKE